MSNKKVVIGVLLIITLTLAGCTALNRSRNSEGNTRESGQESEQETTKTIDPAEEQIRGMTLDEKLGQMVIVGFEGYTISTEIKDIIENHHTGGFILFSRNIKNSDQLLALVNSLKSANSVNKVPLFVSVDEEGGRISRMPAELKKLPSNEAIGKLDNGDLSYEIGSILADEIKLFGFNMDFAPVLDIRSNPKNTVIGDRSFGSSAEVVGKLGVQTMKGIRNGGVIPVVKHFPGHGDTVVDSHIGLPSVNNDMDRLKRLELVPFKEAIDNQADAVMIAHILLNKIDPKNPASLSKSIITDLLRSQLNFNGVVITDDMTMGAILKNYNIGDAAVKSVNAGSDIILVCHGLDNELAVFNALKKAVMDGTITEKRIDESVYRILKLKYKYNLADILIDSVNTDNINSKINKILRTYFKRK